jgi:hypothetical protein
VQLTFDLEIVNFCLTKSLPYALRTGLGKPNSSTDGHVHSTRTDYLQTTARKALGFYFGKNDKAQRMGRRMKGSPIQLKQQISKSLLDLDPWERESYCQQDYWKYEINCDYFGTMCLNLFLHEKCQYGLNPPRTCTKAIP